MAYIEQNIVVHRGNTAEIIVDLDTVEGDPFFASGPGIEIEWRLATNDNRVAVTLVRKTLSDGTIEKTADGNGVKFMLAAADTDFRCRKYYHEMKIYDGIDVATVMIGEMEIQPALVMGPIAVPATIDQNLITHEPVVS